MDSSQLVVPGFGPETLVDEGTGPALLVVHGGPGMDFSYMRRTLSALTSDFRVVFYEQSPHRGQALDPQFAATDQFAELQTVVRALTSSTREPIRIVAHSWGTYLVLELLASADRPPISHTVLLNPLPLTWERLAEAGNRLGSRVRPEHISEVERLEQAGTEEAGKELMDLVGYAYLAPENRGSVDPNVGRYNPLVNAQVTASIEGYDQTSDRYSAITDLRLGVIHGDSDYIEPEDTIELLAVASQDIISKCGHFPFAEAPEVLLQKLRAQLAD